MVPTVALQGEADGVHPPQASETHASYFTGPFQRRVLGTDQDARVLLADWMTKKGFTVTVKRVAESTDIDPHFTMPAHSLTLSPDGHLSIEGQYQSRAFSRGAWDTFEVKRIFAGRR